MKQCVILVLPLHRINRFIDRWDQGIEESCLNKKLLFFGPKKLLLMTFFKIFEIEKNLLLREG